MKVREALDQFILQGMANGRSPHTIVQCRRFVGWLADWLGAEDQLEWIDHGVVARFLTSDVVLRRADGRPKKATSVNALRGSICCFFRYCVRAGLLERDPGALVERARVHAAPPRSLSEEEQRRLLAALVGTGRDQALFVLMLGTGIRIGSALALRVEDVDLERGELWVHDGKGGHSDRIYIGRYARERLREYLGGRRSGPLFARQSGEPMNTQLAARRLRHWLARAHVTWGASPHTLRHSFATNLYARTHDLLLVQAALLHRSVASTALYAHVSGDRVRHALM